MSGIPGVNVINFFSSLQKTRPNKLECLYLTITLQSSLTFAGNTRSLPKKETSERSSDWVCSGLALKFKDPTGKGFPRANPLGYWASLSVTKEKSFITLAPDEHQLQVSVALDISGKLLLHRHLGTIL